MKHVSVSVKIIERAQDYRWNSSTCICESGRYLKRIATDIVSMKVTNTIPTKMTNTVSANVTSTVSIHFDDKKSKIKNVLFYSAYYFISD